MTKKIRIGTRDSELALWQATEVQQLLIQQGYQAELVLIKSEGDIDLVTPLYEMGVQGVFTRSLDSALLNHRIDIAVHSMKDVPVQLPQGIIQAAVLKRGSYKDMLVPHPDLGEALSAAILGRGSEAVIATSSVRRKAQWLHRYPQHQVESLRGNVNTRLNKLKTQGWHGAIFAAAGLERINLRPENAIYLNWMLPAPAQGAIMVVCRENDDFCLEACTGFNDMETALCTKIERDFLKALLGGCSTPISALATVKDGDIHFKGNILSVDGQLKAEVEFTRPVEQYETLGSDAAKHLLGNGGQAIADGIRSC